MSDFVLEAQGIKKSFSQGAGELEILKGLSIKVKENDDICIVGSSGAGKSTFLHILGTLDVPSEGKVFYRGEDLFIKSDKDLARFRNNELGFVFQFHHLMNEFDVLENVMMPAFIAGQSKKDSKDRARQLLEQLGMTSRITHFPSQLSGGEKQRVAIARSLVMNPRVLFADEPTGNLDKTNSLMVQDLLFQVKEERNLTLIVVTHDTSFAKKFSNVYEMKDGLWDIDSVVQE